MRIIVKPNIYIVLRFFSDFKMLINIIFESEMEILKP